MIGSAMWRKNPRAIPMHDIIRHERDDDDASDFDAKDLAALERCLKIVCEEGSDAGEFFEGLLKERDRTDVLLSACYHVQMKSLQLHAWEIPPCIGRGAAAQRLADRMMQLGLSVYEPDPLAALAAAKRRKTPDKALYFG